MYRRRFLATTAALSVPLATAGCLGGEDGGYEFDAAPATIAAATLADAGYEHEEPEPFTVENEFEAAGVEVHVSATTWSAAYANPDREAALFAVSTPDATVAGQSVNPLVRGGDGELLRRILERVGDDTDDVDADEFERRGSETRRILGTETDVSTFEGRIDAGAAGSVDSATDAGGESGDVPVLVHFATVEHDGDVVVLAGVHPRPVDERETILSLMEAVEH